MEDNVIDVLDRWTDSGAIWRVDTRTSTSVTISMHRCDGGEEVERLRTTDPAVIDWLGDRTSSEDH
jgi:hypothetical protein